MIAQRLHLDEVDGGFVRSCRAACLEDCSRQLDILERLASKANRPQGNEDECDRIPRIERLMYPHLVRW